MMTDAIDILVNGEARAVPHGASLLDVLQELQLDPRSVVVEHNQTIIRRSELADTRVVPGDSLELVHFVGGG